MHRISVQGVLGSNSIKEMGFFFFQIHFIFIRWGLIRNVLNESQKIIYTLNQMLFSLNVGVMSHCIFNESRLLADHMMSSFYLSHRHSTEPMETKV